MQTLSWAARRFNKGSWNSETEMILMNYNGCENRTIYHSFIQLISSQFLLISHVHFLFWHFATLHAAHDHNSNFFLLIPFQITFFCNFTHKLYYDDWFFFSNFFLVQTSTNTFHLNWTENRVWLFEEKINSVIASSGAARIYIVAQSMEKWVSNWMTKCRNLSWISFIISWNLSTLFFHLLQFCCVENEIGIAVPLRIVTVYQQR